MAQTQLWITAPAELEGYSIKASRSRDGLRSWQFIPLSIIPANSSCLTHLESLWNCRNWSPSREFPSTKEFPCSHRDVCECYGRFRVLLTPVSAWHKLLPATLQWPAALEQDVFQFPVQSIGSDPRSLRKWEAAGRETQPWMLGLFLRKQRIHFRLARNIRKKTSDLDYNQIKDGIERKLSFMLWIIVLFFCVRLFSISFLFQNHLNYLICKRSN